jgi:trypsin-like peptidase
MALYWNCIPIEPIRSCMHSAIILCAAGSLVAAAEPYSDAGPAVIQIHVDGILKSLPAHAKTKDFHDDATGFIVSPDGLVMTAGHVVPDPNEFEDGTLTIEGRFASDVGGGLKAEDPPSSLKIVKSARTPHDVGLLQIEDAKKPLPFLRLCDDYKPGEPLILLGYLGGDTTLAIRQGIVSKPGIDPNPMLMQMPMFRGDSGGPVFNTKGGVIGIGIGQLKVNQERVEVMNFAELVRAAITAMSPETKALIGTSYDPQCDKKLATPAGPVTAEVKLDQAASVELRSGQSTTLTQTFQAPAGSVFDEIVGVNTRSTSGRILATPSSPIILNDGNTIQMTLEARTESSIFDALRESLGGQPARTTVNSQVSATIKRAPTQPVVPSSSPQPQVRSYLVSKTLDVHGPSATRQVYSDEILAPAGYRFLQILSVKVAALGHSPTNGVEASIGGEGNFFRATYSLESGPIDDPWKAWIDAFVTAKLAPVSR